MVRTKDSTRVRVQLVMDRDDWELLRAVRRNIRANVLSDSQALNAAERILRYYEEEGQIPPIELQTHYVIEKKQAETRFALVMLLTRIIRQFKNGRRVVVRHPAQLELATRDGRVVDPATGETLD